MDYASITPVRKEVMSVMEPFLKEFFANPSALYKEGVDNKTAIEKAREEIALDINGRPGEIIFTASGTESNNLALFGIFNFFKKDKFVPHIVTSVIEHPAILEVCKEIEKLGGEVTYLPVDSQGFVLISDIKKSLRKNTVLVSIMYANNEIGTIQPIREIAKTVRAFRKSSSNIYPYFHTDASQAANYLNLNVAELGVDMMTLDGGKIYGPRGVGVLFFKKGVSLAPVLHGGGQEGGLRSGTENISGIIGFAKALGLAVSEREKESARLIALRNYFISSVLEKIPNSSLNGSLEDRLPNNINICIPNISGEFAVIKLDSLGVACSSSSSCRAISENSFSYVVEALNNNRKCAESSLRFTLGRNTKKADVGKVVNLLPRLF